LCGTVDVTGRVPFVVATLTLVGNAKDAGQVLWSVVDTRQ
jgi:hypothetical protein